MMLPLALAAVLAGDPSTTARTVTGTRARHRTDLGTGRDGNRDRSSEE
jgi:hypothetical protein